MAGQGGARAGTIFIFAVTPICFFLISDVAMSTSLSQHADNANIGQVTRPPTLRKEETAPLLLPVLTVLLSSVVSPRFWTRLWHSSLVQLWPDAVSESATCTLRNPICLHHTYVYTI